MPLTEAEQKELEQLEAENDALHAQSQPEPAALAGPGMGRKILQAVTTPIRGLRAAGVGAELMVRKAFGKNSTNTFGAPDPKSLDEIAERASLATQSGFQPKATERIGAAAGEAVATAPIMAMTGGGGLMGQMLKGALSTGAMTAVMEASERGDVEPVDVVSSAALGGAVPLIAPSLRAVARAIRGSAKVAATSGTTLEREAVDELLNDPQLLEKYRGTAESVGEKVKDIQKALISQHEEAGALLEKARAKVGLHEPFEDALARVQREGFRPTDVKEIVNDFEILSKDQIPPNLLAKAKASAMDYSKELAKSTKAKPATLTTNARLRDLIRLRGQVDDVVSWPTVSADVPKIGSADQHLLKQLRDKINGVIENIPGGKDLRDADEIYSTSRRLYDDFQRAMATEGKAEDLIRRISKGGDLEDLIGSKGQYARLVRQIEKKKGVQLLAPAKKELAARSFRKMEARGTSGIPAESIGPEGVASMLLGADKAARVPDQMSRAFTPTVSALMQAGASHSMRRRKP